MWFMRIYTVMVFGLFFFNTLAQQPNEECITQVSEDILELEYENQELYNYYIDEYFEKLNNKSSTAITQIPAKLHIVTDSGGNTSVSINDILNELDEANTHLAASFLEIYICDEINYRFKLCFSVRRVDFDDLCFWMLCEKVRPDAIKQFPLHI